MNAPPFDLVVASRRTLVHGRLRPGWIALRDGLVVRCGVGPAPRATARRDAGDAPIGPALVDTHVHGFGGYDASAPGVDGLRAMARALFAAGTGAFCPTLYPLSPEATLERLAAMSEVQKSPEPGEAAIIGAHLEGPFVSPDRPGALESAALRRPDEKLLERFLDTGMVRVVTLAPELPGADRLIRACVRAGAVVSMGHSLASLEQCRRAAKLGAGSVTHVFNAMGAIHHRNATLANFALLEPGFPTELIGDLQHVSAPTIDLLLRARGAEGIRLVSDALAVAGTRTRSFRAGGAELKVRDGIAYKNDGTIAGSARSLASNVAGLWRSGLLSLEEAWAMASEVPARCVSASLVRGYAEIPADAKGTKK